MCRGFPTYKRCPSSKSSKSTALHNVNRRIRKINAQVLAEIPGAADKLVIIKQEKASIFTNAMEHEDNFNSSYLYTNRVYSDPRPVEVTNPAFTDYAHLTDEEVEENGDGSPDPYEASLSRMLLNERKLAREATLAGVRWHPENGAPAAEDAHDNWIALNPGEVDDAARYVYENGQCFTFAAQLRNITGGQIIARSDVPCDGDYDEEDYDADDDDADDDYASGIDIEFKKATSWDSNVTHMVVHLNGHIYDINGDCGTVEEYIRNNSDSDNTATLIPLTGSTLDERIAASTDMAPQDSRLALTFATTIAKENNILRQD